MLVDQLAQSEPLVQFPNENQATIRGDARSLEIDFEKSVEGELKTTCFLFHPSTSPAQSFRSVLFAPILTRFAARTQ